MKFWELTSTFREEPSVLLQVFKQDKWAKYYGYYKRLDQLIQEQQRNILDEEVPFDLSYEVAEKSGTEYWLSFEELPQVLYSYRPEVEYLERLLPVEILVRFGGDKIEAAHEYGSTNVQSRSLEGNVEVIGSYNLTSIGLVGVLRTEKNKLADDSHLSTADRSRSWTVIREFKLLAVDPYSAYEKLEAQKKQNIWHYQLKGVGHSDKPKPGDILSPQRKVQQQ